MSYSNDTLSEKPPLATWLKRSNLPAWPHRDSLICLPSSLHLTIWIDFLHLPLYLVTYSCHGYLLKAYHVLSAVLEIPQKTKKTWLPRTDTQRVLGAFWTEKWHDLACVLEGPFWLLCWEGAAGRHGRRLFRRPWPSPRQESVKEGVSLGAHTCIYLYFCNKMNLCSYIPFYHCTYYSTICHLHLSISINMELYHNFNLFVLVSCMVVS